MSIFIHTEPPVGLPLPKLFLGWWFCNRILTDFFIHSKICHHQVIAQVLCLSQQPARTVPSLPGLRSLLWLRPIAQHGIRLLRKLSLWEGAVRISGTLSFFPCRTLQPEVGLRRGWLKDLTWKHYGKTSTWKGWSLNPVTIRKQNFTWLQVFCMR